MGRLEEAVAFSRQAAEIYLLWQNLSKLKGEPVIISLVL